MCLDVADHVCETEQLQPLVTVLCCLVALHPSLHCVAFPVSLLLTWQRNTEVGT